MNTITVTGKDRPWLFRDMLVTLRENDLTGWRVLIAIDGDRGQEFAKIASDHLSGVGYELTVNTMSLGIKINPYLLLSRAFAAGSMLNLYLEEDLLIAPDVTAMALWYARNHRPHWACLNLIAGPCGSAGLLSNPSLPDVLFEARTFNSLGFIARRTEWFEVIAPVWLGSDDRSKPGGSFSSWHTHWGWDWSVYAAIAHSPTMVSVQPVLARATHTGREGTYANAAFHDRAFGNLTINTARDCQYHVSNIDGLPHVVRSHIHLHQETTAFRLALEQGATNKSVLDG